MDSLRPLRYDEEISCGGVNLFPLAPTVGAPNLKEHGKGSGGTRGLFLTCEAWLRGTEGEKRILENTHPEHLQGRRPVRRHLRGCFPGRRRGPQRHRLPASERHAAVLLPQRNSPFRAHRWASSEPPAIPARSARSPSGAGFRAVNRRSSREPPGPAGCPFAASSPWARPRPTCN